MVFSSITFLFFFLPAFLLIFHLLRHQKLQFVFLLFSSMLFYFWGENFLIWILLTSTGIDYFSSLLIANGFKKKEILKLIPDNRRSRLQKTGLIISIVSNLSFLGYFKYANFFVENFISFCHSSGLDSFIPEQSVSIILPLGISFYTFQSMSYTIDVYRGRITATRNFIKFASYVTMFPQLVAGPIVRYSDIEKQINNHSTTVDDFVIGIKRFIIGLSKKVLIANTMALVADTVFALPSNELSTGLAWIGIIAYSLQIYFDFSGYSCMAIGLGRMMGFTFPENFNYPYISRSIREFWRRWHISLSSWFRDYLFIPLGGSKNGSLITYRNLIIVFLVCGLWHGASWNFVVWGIFHGFFLIIEKLPFTKYLNKIPDIFQHLYVLFFVSLGWVFFRTETINEGIHYSLVLLGINSAQFQISMFYEIIQTNVLIIFFVGIIFSMPVFPVIQKKIKILPYNTKTAFELIYLALLVCLFLLSTMSLASGTYNPFIYFRF